MRQAFFDQARGVLAVAVTPGTDYRGSVAFNVRNLPRGAYTVLLDGQPMATISGRQVKTIGQALAVSWMKNGDLNLAFSLNDGRAIRIDPSRSNQIAAR